MRRRFLPIAIGGAALLASATFAGRVVRANSLAPGLGPDSLASPAGPGSGEPSLAVGPDGKVYMSWLEPVDSSFAFKFAVADRGRWSAPRTIRAGRDFFVNWADFPSIEVLGQGRMAAHWLQRTGSATYAYGVRVSMSADGGRTWGAPIRPHTDTSHTEHGFVSLWRDGKALGAVWLDGRKYSKEGHSPANEMVLASASFHPDGRVASGEVIIDERVCDCCQTSVAMTSAGPIIVYRDRSPDEIRDIYVIRRVDVAPRAVRRWTTPAPIHRDGWKIAACPVNGPAIAADRNDVAVAWFTAANDSARVKLAFSRNAGETFDSPVRIDGGTPAGRVDVALLPDGSALVSWVERVGGDVAAVRARRVRRDGTLSLPVTIATSSAARASGFPRMAIADKHAVFAWTMPGKPSQVRVSRLELADIP